MGSEITAAAVALILFLMFHLRRPDVLPVGDLGIRRAVDKVYGLPGLPDEEDLRTLACLYLWKTLE